MNSLRLSIYCFSIIAGIGCLLLTGHVSIGQNVLHSPSDDKAAQEKLPINRLRKIGDRWTNSIGMNFTYIPAGEFDMGSPVDERGRWQDETLHHVKLTRAFLMSTTVVTQSQWRLVMEKNQSWFRGQDRPAERLDWDQAVEFCELLSEKEAKHYRLPTEAEWEYACRAGTRTRYNTGDTDNALARAGWYGANSGRQTHPVAIKKPNGWGLYDMHGNVWQWCSDTMGDYHPGSVTNPQGPDPKPVNRRVLRGGCWESDAEMCRSAVRYCEWEFNGRDFVGFRVVLDLH